MSAAAPADRPAAGARCGGALGRLALAGALVASLAGTPGSAIAQPKPAMTQPAMTQPAMTQHAMTQHATGTFTVVIQPQPTVAAASGATPNGVGRMSIDKTFSGDLVGSGSGEMLTALTETQGSAGYVAVEKVTGALHGKQGSFMLQHTGTMDRGAPTLSVTVVPDSGSGALVGITGRLAIRIADGKHYYDFDYSLP